ncbi:MAG: interleukin-like EMT inducer domain-containing protein [Anaerolineae bacterium]
MHRIGRRWRIFLTVLAVYTLLALILTWPLLAHLGSHVPGDGADDPPLTWNLWWLRYALLNLGSNPFDCDYLFYPLGINLAFYTLTVLNGLLSLGLQATIGLVPASNLLLLSSFILSAFGAFLLAYHLLSRPVVRKSIIETEPPLHVSVAAQSPPASESGIASSSKDGAPTKKPSLRGASAVAERRSNPRLINVSDRHVLWLASFAAGLVYAFASAKMSYAALGQWNIASSQWIPFYVLYLFKSGEQPRRWRYPLLAALFLLFQAYAELTYASFLVLFTLLWAGWRAWRALRQRQMGHLPPLALRLSVLALLFVAGLAPVLAMMLPDLAAEGDIFVQGGGFADVFSADLLGFLVPNRLHPLFGSLVESFQFHHGVGQHLYLGYGLLALAAVGVVAGRRRPAVRFWLLSAAVFWLLTLGPTLQVNGHDTGLPLPFALVARLPFFKGNRYPSRYSVLLFLSLGLLVAYGVQAMGRRLRLPRGRAATAGYGLLLAVVLLFGHLSAPLPLSDMRVPQVYQAIAGEMPGDWTLLDIPVAWRNGFRVTGTQHPIIMFEQYYQSVHGKRLLAGNTSRNPPLKFQYFTRAPVINTLIALETDHRVDAAIVARDRELAADVLRFFDVQAIVVHPAQAGPGVAPYVEHTLPVQRFYQDDDVVGYRVNLPPWPETWAVTPGGALAGLSYAEGWGLPAANTIWAQRRTVRLLMPLQGGPATMSFRAYAPLAGQRMWLEAGDWRSDAVELAPGWHDYQLSLPLQTGLNELWLHFEGLAPAAGVRQAGRAIGTTGVEAPTNLAVESAGLEVGALAHIYVDGRDVAPGGRGYNVAVLDPATGQVLETAVFDTHLDEGASAALADFLSAVPRGRIVAVAAADEASRLLGEDAVQALHGIGALGDLREKFRWGQAIIGVQGAPPGSALEALDWMQPVAVVVGEGATEPTLAAAFAEIRITSGASSP